MTDRPEPSTYTGMTVNERLFAAGMMDAFDAAARRRNRAAVVMILESVEFTLEDAQACVESLLADPAKYGF